MQNKEKPNVPEDNSIPIYALCVCVAPFTPVKLIKSDGEITPMPKIGCLKNRLRDFSHIIVLPDKDMDLSNMTDNKDENLPDITKAVNINKQIINTLYLFKISLNILNLIKSK